MHYLNLRTPLQCWPCARVRDENKSKDCSIVAMFAAFSTAVNSRDSIAKGGQQRYTTTHHLRILNCLCHRSALLIQDAVCPAFRVELGLQLAHLRSETTYSICTRNTTSVAVSQQVRHTQPYIWSTTVFLFMTMNYAITSLQRLRFRLRYRWRHVSVPVVWWYGGMVVWW